MRGTACVKSFASPPTQRRGRRGAGAQRDGSRRRGPNVPDARAPDPFRSGLRGRSARSSCTRETRGFGCTGRRGRPAVHTHMCPRSHDPGSADLFDPDPRLHRVHWPREASPSPFYDDKSPAAETSTRGGAGGRPPRARGSQAGDRPSRGQRRRGRASKLHFRVYHLGASRSLHLAYKGPHGNLCVLQKVMAPLPTPPREALCGVIRGESLTSLRLAPSFSGTFTFVYGVVSVLGSSPSPEEVQ